MAERDTREEQAEAWMRAAIEEAHGVTAAQQLVVSAALSTNGSLLDLQLLYQYGNERRVPLRLGDYPDERALEEAVRTATRELLTLVGLPPEPLSVTDAARKYQVPDPMVTGGGSWSDAEAPSNTTTGAGVAPRQGPSGGP